MSISRENAEHYQWGNQCEGWHLVKNRALSVIEESMPPGTTEVRHHHRQAQQFFYILDGEAVMEGEGQATVLQTGHGIHIPPGTRHQIRNRSSRPVRFLVISQPPSHGDRVTEE